MTGEIHFESRYMVHESGTKFYETVTFINAEAKLFATVKRWGKIAAAPGGGEVLVDEASSARAATSAAEKVIESKRKRGYSLASSTHGFHALSTSYKTEEEFVAAVKKHYTSGVHQSVVLSSMGIPDGGMVVNARPDDADDIVSEEPAPEPDRDDTYGSW